MTHHFTVVLRVPDTLADTFGDGYGADFYVALIECPDNDVDSAIKQAQAEAYEAWAKDIGLTALVRNAGASDFYPVVALFGKSTIAKFGWQR